MTRVSLRRTVVRLSVLVALGLIAAGSAGAVTITSWVGGKAAVPQVVTAAGSCPGTVVTINGSGFVNDGGSPASVSGRPVGRSRIGSTRCFARTGAAQRTARSSSAPGLAPPLLARLPSSTRASRRPPRRLHPRLSRSRPSGEEREEAHADGSGFVGTTSVRIGTKAPRTRSPRQPHVRDRAGRREGRPAHDRGHEQQGKREGGVPEDRVAGPRPCSDRPPGTRREAGSFCGYLATIETQS